MAVGAEYNRIDLSFGTRAGPTSNIVQTTLAGRVRNFKSLYGELYIPLFSDRNAIPGIQSLILSAAGRFDSYNDFGNTVNPKAGINWSPVDGLTLRGSYGTSFRAPNMSSLTSNNPSLTVQTFVDPLSATGTTSGYAWTEGNPASSQKRPRPIRLVRN